MFGVYENILGWETGREPPRRYVGMMQEFVGKNVRRWAVSCLSGLRSSTWETCRSLPARANDRLRRLIDLQEVRDGDCLSKIDQRIVVFYLVGVTLSNFIAADANLESQRHLLLES